MEEDMSLKDFLQFLSNCTGDDAIEIISKFQNGAITVAGFGVEEFE